MTDFEKCPFYQTFQNLEIKPKDILEMKEEIKVMQTQVKFNLYSQIVGLLGLGALILKVFI